MPHPRRLPIERHASPRELTAGEQVPVVIDAVRAVAFDDGHKLELRFRGKHKVLMANKTNAMRIADQHGDDYDTWPGKAIFLQRDQTEFKGQRVECVRVVRRPIAVQQASQMQQPPAAQPQATPVGVPGSQTARANEHYAGSNDIPFCVTDARRQRQVSNLDPPRRAR